MNPAANQRGQYTIEAVLLLLIFTGIVATAGATMKKNEFVKRLVQGPWTNLSGMFQNGIWAPPLAGQPAHPTTHSRHITVLGESAR
jgi:hypothetical protein